MKEIERLHFLLGRWKSRSVDQFGEKGVLEGTMECTLGPSEQILQIQGETRKDGKVLNRAIQFIAYDTNVRRYILKRVWSMGFIENGVGTWKNGRLLFQITFDCEPRFFRGMRWRSFIHRYGENEIGTGLYAARGSGRYRLYGESRATRVRT
jgi:hypothetical protein